ncbi:TorF family putative porin, partial [Cupriavidus necator]
MAQSQPDAVPSPHTFTANVSLVSDYRYRGIS